MRSFDIVVIGAGTAGLRAFKAAREHTDRIALIESGPRGTTCARIGCMPSKALIAAAEHARSARLGEDLGISAKLDIDGVRVMERVRRLRDDFVDGVTDQMEDFPDEQVIEGEARFLAPGRLDVGGEIIEAERIVIVTGSEPFVPEEIEEGTGGRYRTIADIWDCEALPERFLVFGAGAIGCEIALAMASLGVKVTCLSKGGSIGLITDPALRELALSAFGGRMQIETEAAFEEMGWQDDEFRIRWSGPGGHGEGRYDKVLVATGRKPNLGTLNLEASGLVLDEKGVPVFDEKTRICEGAEGRVFIAGDVDGGDMVLPMASWAGDVAGRQAASWPKVIAGEPPLRMLIGFTDPAMATVGQSFSSLDRDRIVVGTADYRDQGRARCENRNQGSVRVYAERGTGRILGAEMLAPDAEHLAHLLAWGVASGHDALTLSKMPLYHPVTEEGLRTALRDAASQACA